MCKEVISARKIQEITYIDDTKTFMDIRGDIELDIWFEHYIKFINHCGRPYKTNNVDKKFRYIRKCISEIYPDDDFTDITPHCLRHTFATRCFEKGMTPRTVQEIMGHANYNTTVSYTHVLDDMKTKEAERVGDF